MNRTEMLTLAARIFGQARIVTTLTNVGLRPLIETVLEVKAARDGAWRPLGNVGFDQTNAPLVSAHPKALNEDLNRAASLLNAS